MKFWWLIIILVLVFLVSLKSGGEPMPPLTPKASPNLPLDQLSLVNFEDSAYRFTWFEIKNPDRLNLYPNYPDLLSSNKLVDSYGCKYFLNGGFYAADHRPLGWLVSDGKQLSAPINSSLFDGFLTVDDRAVIAFSPPDDLPRLGLQSGPVLIFDGKALSLNLTDDSLRRRVVAGLTADNKLIFVVIAGKDSTLSGPLLADLPELLSTIGKQLGLTWQAAINLDGGTASAFITPQLTLTELNPVGNFFCYN